MAPCREGIPANRKGDVMSKAKKLGLPKPIPQRSKHGRSDIPYRDRLLMSKYATVAGHRDDAARVALKIATVALNDTEGLGYTRLCRFAKRQQQLMEEYYSDPEYMEIKLNQRLMSMGFLVENGHMYGAVDGDGNTVPTKVLMDDG